MPKPTLVPTSATISKVSQVSHQNEHAAVESITDEEKWQGLHKNTPLGPTSASICKESHQNEYAAVKTSLTSRSGRDYA
jgi:hypothetical protein